MAHKGHEEAQAFWATYMRGSNRIESAEEWRTAKRYSGSWTTCCLGAQSTEFEGRDPLMWDGVDRGGTNPMNATQEELRRLHELQIDFPDAIAQEDFDRAKKAWTETWEILQRLREAHPDLSPWPQPWLEPEPVVTLDSLVPDLDKQKEEA